jgi:hypothetical protein
MQCTIQIIRKWAMKGERKIRDGTKGILRKRTAARDLRKIEGRGRRFNHHRIGGGLGQADESLLGNEFTEILGKVFLFE